MALSEHTKALKVRLVQELELILRHNPKIHNVQIEWTTFDHRIASGNQWHFCVSQNFGSHAACKSCHGQPNIFDAPENTVLHLRYTEVGLVCVTLGFLNNNPQVDTLLFCLVAHSNETERALLLQSLLQLRHISTLRFVGAILSPPVGGLPVGRERNPGNYLSTLDGGIDSSQRTPRTLGEYWTFGSLLSENTPWKHLTIRAELGLDGLLLLAEGLKVNRGLQRLTINCFTDTVDVSSEMMGAQALGDALKHNTTLVSFSFRLTAPYGREHSVLSPFCDVLSFNQTLSRWSKCMSEITYEQAAQFSDFLQRPRLVPLVCLSLRCSLDHPRLNFCSLLFRDTLVKVPTLQQLTLKNLVFPDQDIPTFCDFIQDPRCTLRRLILKCVQTKHRDVYCAILDAVCENRTLTCLTIVEPVYYEDNNAEIVLSLTRLLQKNSALRRLEHRPGFTGASECLNSDFLSALIANRTLKGLYIPTLAFKDPVCVIQLANFLIERDYIQSPLKKLSFSEQNSDQTVALVYSGLASALSSSRGMRKLFIHGRNQGVVGSVFLPTVPFLNTTLVCCRVDKNSGYHPNSDPRSPWAIFLRRNRQCYEKQKELQRQFWLSIRRRGQFQF